jgi:hypothetical protein
MLLASAPAAAQGSVTPSFGDGKLVLIGEGYRRGERVEITIRVGGATHRFTATADGRGRFRLETGLALQPLSSVEIEARDEQGRTQATITTAPGPLPPPPTTAAPAAAQPVRVPTQLPRTGDGPVLELLLASAVSLLCAGLLLQTGRRRTSR